MIVDPDADTVDLPAPGVGTAPARPFSSLVRVEVAALSHAGKVRPNNEDHYLVGRLGRYLDVQLTSLPERDAPGRSEETGHGFVVADGIGGAEGGELASRLAISTLVNLVLQVPDWILRLDETRAQETIKRVARHYRKVDAEIARRAREDRTLAGMGTTMTLAYSLGADLFVVQVGDSRAYLHRKGKLRRLTRDQTLVQTLLDLGQITPEAAGSHPLRHILTQALGGHGADLKAEVQRLKLADGDCLLLCTDGLTEMVTDDLIARVLRRTGGAEEQCRTLVDLALERGGRDNVTVIVARYRFPDQVTS
jgi:protein phosphatase